MDALNGRVQIIGLASAFFDAEQLADHGMTGEEHLLIVQVDRKDPGSLGMGAVLYAERVQITIPSDA